MDTVTHALIPVICVGVVARHARWIGRRGLVGIGIAGALPDLLNPHLSLESRMTSWSHGIPCWLVLSVLLVVISRFNRGRLSTRLALCLSGAYLLHMICDAISGGVNFLYPYGEWIWGGYWVDPSLWVPLDIICILICYLMFRILPALKARKQEQLNPGGNA
jgi:hypothetical protein